jgi:16S rRNA C1402 (ribose-2'-O) methylase RsmI
MSSRVLIVLDTGLGARSKMSSRVLIVLDLVDLLLAETEFLRLDPRRGLLAKWLELEKRL